MTAAYAPCTNGAAPRSWLVMSVEEVMRRGEQRDDGEREENMISSVREEHTFVSRHTDC